MYTVSQLVVYGIHGVCKILQTEEKRVDGQSVNYFVLEPLAQPGSRYYIPSQNPVALSKIRPLMDKAELLAVLSDQSLKQDWVQQENRRKMVYRQILSSGDVSMLMGMLRVLQTHKQLQAQNGRRIHICDENFERDAEKIIKGEVAVVMELGDQEALSCLRTYLNGIE